MFFINDFVYSQQSFGVLYNENNYPVKIIRNNSCKKIMSKTAKLFRDDTVICKSMKKIIINLAPHVYGKPAGDSMLVIKVKEFPKTKNLVSNIYEFVKEYLGFIKEDFHRTNAVKQRNYSPKPPDTLITAVEFIPVKIDCEDARSFILYDADNKELYTSDLKGKKSFELLPKDLSMHYDTTYTWVVKNGEDERKGKIKIISSELHNRIMNDFLEIEKSTDDKAKQIIMKASYLQMLSDIYETELDLYWLSNQLLDQVEFSRYPEAKLIENRYYNHTAQNSKQ